jgi:hypothetical protein
MRGKFCFRHELGVILVAIYLICCLVPGVLHAQPKQKIHDDLLSVGFPNEKDGWVCGRRGTVLHTADGGKTWVRQSSNTNFTLSSICFVDSQNGWAVGDEGVIIHTENGIEPQITFYLLSLRWDYISQWELFTEIISTCILA